MGFFDNLMTLLTGKPVAEPQPPVVLPLSPTTGDSMPAPRSRALAESFQKLGITVNMTVTGPAEPSVHISEAEVAERVKDHAFVLNTDPPPLKTTDQWWEEETYKRRARDGSDRAYAWLLPFIPLEIAKLESLQKALLWGPHSASELAKALRALIKERRKAKQPSSDLLLALYGVSAIADLSSSLAFEGTQPHYMARFVSLTELQAVQCDYATMGYQCSKSLLKTDIKWLVEVLGEPSEHQSFNAVFPHIQRNAIGRYCWAEVRRANEASKSLGLPQTTMQGWLNGLAKRTLGYHKEWQERVAARKVELEERSSALDAAWAATRGTFVVADLETTGLNAASDEVLEFAAVLVGTSGAISVEFSALVRVKRPVPRIITKITGITQADVDREGCPLPEAMTAFLAFVGSHPVFFHNAPFDAGFLKQAGAQARLKFSNPVHDTLAMAWAVWPSLGTYKLGALAEHVGAPAPTHRGLADAKAALAVLLAARAKAQPLATT